MVKNVIKRFISIILVTLMVLLILPIGLITANADAVSGVTVADLSTDYSGDGTWAGNGNTINGSIAPKESSGCGGTSYSQGTATLTLKNTNNAEAILSFDVTISVASGGSATLDGNSLTVDGIFTKKLAYNETVSLIIKSGEAAGAVTTVSLSNISLSVPRDIHVTFKTPENGSYTVDGEAIVNETTITKNSEESFAVKATANSNYKFIGWKSSINGYISFSASDNLNLYDDQMIEPVFVNSNTAVFDVDGEVFTDLGDAVSYSVSHNSNLITLIQNGTITGEYTIPNGKTLLIPFDSAKTTYTTKPALIMSHSTPSAFRTLTMAAGSSITVESGGTICVPSQLSATGTNGSSWNGTPTGPHGRINLNGDSSIELKSGAKLYCYGYIAGSGTVTANSGSEVWECFQIRSWRGGTAISGMANNSQKVFPLNQYYVQNIEAPLHLKSGATEKVYTAVNASSQAFGASATFIGSGGMFNISSGSLVKKYDGGTDRLIVDLSGSCSVTPMSLKITGIPWVGTINLNTENFVLPINSNIKINVESGTTSISQDMALIPGTELNIASGAKLNIANGHKVYIYDKDQWGAYAASGSQLVPVGYSTVNGTTAKRTTASLVDSKVDVNGEIDVNGAMYTTESGADIISSQGTGKVNLIAAPGNQTETYQATQSGSNMTYVSIPITPAKLHNGCANPVYTETAGEPANTIFGYCHACDKWVKLPHNDNTYTITWKNEDGTVLREDTVPEGELPVYGEVPTKEATAEYTYTFAGWSPEVVAAEADAEYTATFTAAPREYTITWKNEDGTELASGKVAYGTVPEYTGETPTKESDAQYSYTFAGWNPEVVEVTGDATYTATFTNTENKYTVTWKNADGTVLETDENVVYGARPEYNGETPAKAADVQYTYTFDGWDPALSEVTGDVTYTAKFSRELNKYTVTWKNYDGTVLKTEEVEYGKTPEYSGEKPTKPEDEQYAYTFSGWTPELAPVTGAAEYTAQFSQTVRTYTVTWKNADGTVLETDENVAYGAMPEYNGDTPAKDGGAQYTYTFTGWDHEVSEVKADVTYTAQFSESVKTYTVKWTDEEGKVLETDENVPYGATPEFNGTTPSKEGNAQYSYSFAGWTPDVVAVAGDVTYKATFTETVNTYKITWKNEDGKVLETDEDVPYGAIPEYNGETPAKEATEQYTYSFEKWTPDVVPVEEDAVYTASYTTSTNTYTVIWQNWDESELEKDTNVAYGTEPEYNGTTPTKEGNAQYSYRFIGWTPDVDEITGDTTFTAVFDETVNTYSVTWKNWDGEVLAEESYPYGSRPSYSGTEPARESTEQYDYTFKGWDSEIVEVEGDAVYTAVFKESVRTYKVTWLNSNGEVLETDLNVPYGDTPSYDGAEPSIPSTEQFTYKFTGWDPEVSAVKGVQTYTAKYESQTRKYTVTFNSNGGEGTMNPQEVSYGETVNLNKNQFTKEGYVFSKWTTEADGSGSVYGDEAELAGGLSGDLTLYAQWMLAGWHRDENGLTWYENGVQKYFGTWATIDGKDYYFKTDGYVATGLYRTTSKDGSHEATFIFDEETGKFMADQNGIYEHGDDTYWTKAGEVVVNAGLVRVEKEDREINYYYFGEDSKAVKNGVFKVENNNDLPLPCFNYNFGPDGVIEHDPDTSKNGICDGDGSVYYYIDGVKVGVGLIQVNGSYYYAKTSSGEIVRDRSYWITQTNKLSVEAGIYEFDKDGKMILNGWIHDGSNTYYYVDGDRAKGLTKIGDDYYFFNKSSGKLYKGMTLWVGDNEYGFVGGMYYFDAEGKMVIPDLENGEKKIVSDEGNLYLTIDGKRMTDGLYELDGEYYYAQSSGKLAVNKAVYASNKEEGVISTLQAKKNYWLYFGEGGKLQKTGFVETKDGTYYYKDCSIALGFTKIGDDYYLFNRSNGRMSRNATMWVGDNGYGIEGGMYYFDAEGKMAQ